MNTQNLDRRNISDLPESFWTDYEFENRVPYEVPLYDAVGELLRIRGADTPQSSALAVAEALHLETEENDGIVWASSDVAHLVADRIFGWEVASYSLLKDHGLENLFPLDLSR